MRDPYQSLGVPFVAYALRQQISADGPDPLLGVSEDGENVRRVRPMEKDTNGAWNRTVYVVSTAIMKWGIWLMCVERIRR
jgi:lupus La protein